MMPVPLEPHGELFSLAWAALPGEVVSDDTLLLTFDGHTAIVSLVHRVPTQIVMNQPLSPENYALALCLCAFPAGCSFSVLARALLQAPLMRCQADLAAVRTLLLTSPLEDRVVTRSERRWLTERLSKLRKKLAPLGLDIVRRKGGQYGLFRQRLPLLTAKDKDA